MLTHDEYKDYCKRFKGVEGYLKSKSADPKVVAYNICKLRGYYPNRMTDVLVRAGFLYIEESESVYDPLDGSGDDLGLFKNGRFLLANRFIFPVKDMLGNTVALIGWFPDEKKYITTPSRLFSKSCLFYGLEQFISSGVGAEYFLCEGIFDALSLRSIGFNAVSEMGVTSGRVKEGLYPLFGRLIGVPDADAEGKKVVGSDMWRLPSNSSYLKWVGGSYKDIDLVVNSFEAEDVREELCRCIKGKERLLTLDLR